MEHIRNWILQHAGEKRSVQDVVEALQSAMDHARTEATYKMSSQRYSQPWITRELKQLIRCRHSAPVSHRSHEN
ncbi:hypothetical protein KP79_PYT21965 [Mizuhopecten yessoensis]|uniref:Uncharacterized protein n=1 Tax=Mizuhopecten yessoensis TaxID=6573 RepID=A0A210Q0A4_MIZYE|nr:hypothetical protein KP79_PYT21965 [Mizuhopecten yessoensis]